VCVVAGTDSSPSEQVKVAGCCEHRMTHLDYCEHRMTHLDYCEHSNDQFGLCTSTNISWPAEETLTFQRLCLLETTWFSYLLMSLLPQFNWNYFWKWNCYNLYTGMSVCSSPRSLCTATGLTAGTCIRFFFFFSHRVRRFKQQHMSASGTNIPKWWNTTCWWLLHVLRRLFSSLPTSSMSSLYKHLARYSIL
jgi:hypothetical protein